MACYLNRTMCEVLEEMRAAYNSRNFAAMMGLIDEVQSMANRMEAKLADGNDVERWTEQRRALAREIKSETAKVEKIRREIEDLEERMEKDSHE